MKRKCSDDNKKSSIKTLRILTILIISFICRIWQSSEQENLSCLIIVSTSADKTFNYRDKKVSYVFFFYLNLISLDNSFLDLIASPHISTRL